MPRMWWTPTAASPRSLRVVADIPAGSHPTISLAPGEAARIMTGAQMPEGADAVIPVEDTDFNDRDAGTPAPDEVQIFKPAKSGENIRPRGMDIHAGEVVLHKGRVLKPQDLGLLAMLDLQTYLSIANRALLCFPPAMNCSKWMLRLKLARSAIRIPTRSPR